jgi:LysM repeat protein
MKLFLIALLNALLIAGQIGNPVQGAPMNAQLVSEPCGVTYKVQLRDTLSEIADDCDTTVESILALNPEITNPSLIFIGQVLQISGSTSEINDYPTAYLVQPGDSLGDIARLFGTTVWEIKKVNPHVWYENPIYAGMVLYIPSSSAYMDYPRVSLDVTVAAGGDDVTVYVRGFPANSEIDYRVGRQGEDPEDVYDGSVGADGTTSETITLPEDLEEGEYWVVQVKTTSQKDGVTVTSHAIYIDNY